MREVRVSTISGPKYVVRCSCGTPILASFRTLAKAEAYATRHNITRHRSSYAVKIG